MRSKWFELKETVIELRKTGMSMTVIEKQFGIPRSTLSGWFKRIELSEAQKTKLIKNSQDAWLKAPERAGNWHRAQKALRLLEAKKEAIKTLEEIELTPAVLDLAFAMLYLGEGAKNRTTALASSDPLILKFVLAVLRRNYGITPDMVRCDLHLRMDQNLDELKQYWSGELKIPLTQFKYAAFDKRSLGKPTYAHYKGVCVLSIGNIAIQRKLIYLYNLFCEKLAAMESGD